MYKLKKKWFCGVQNMTIVTPSQWLADLVKQSFLKEYPVRVIHNGIDLSAFHPVKSNVREKYGIPEDTKLLLAVAFGWSAQKGLNEIISLAKDLPENYRIMMVGTDGTTDAQLPKNIISIHRTNDQQEMAAVYTAADLFVMPSREETYPTVVMEAIACGTPAVLYDAGGGKEILTEKTGLVVPCDDYDAFYKAIVQICEEKPYQQEDCLERAEDFSAAPKFEAYVELYDQIAVCK
jgi:glycosyltransferase involved in cell wall biosynthesis